LKSVGAKSKVVASHTHSKTSQKVKRAVPIERANVTRLSAAAMRKLILLLEHPKKPNKQLRAALEDFRKNVRA
jgi:uncharacterized protein (DUF1778 family)